MSLQVIELLTMLLYKKRTRNSDGFAALNTTDLEFRYLNSKSVRVNPDLATETYGFERKLNGFGV